MLKLRKKVPKLLPKAAPVTPVEEVGEMLTMGDNTLDKLLHRAIVIDDECVDYSIGNVSELNLHLNDDRSISYVPDGMEKRTVGITRYALSQLGTKIGVPVNYLEKCFKRERPDIAQYNVNEWVKEYGNGLFIREHKNEIRGVLSPKYAVCDLPDILSVVDEVLQKDPRKVKGSERFKVKGSFISPERFHCRLVERERMNVTGEDLFAGMTIDSSDVGRSTLNVQFIVWKKVCSNGLIVPQSSFTLFKQKHIGVTAEAFRDSFMESIKLFPDLAARVAGMIERTRKAQSMFDFSVKDEEQMKSLIDSIRRTTELSPLGAEKVVDIMQSGKYADNRWGYINALTEVAQDLTLEKRISLESYAGRLLAA